MSLFVEIHLIQNFAPSNLNRDDTGSPKDALFGGQRRARVSSQCFKRAIRLAAREHQLIAPEHQGIRTKKLQELLLKRLDQRDPLEASIETFRRLFIPGTVAILTNVIGFATLAFINILRGITKDEDKREKAFLGVLLFWSVGGLFLFFAYLAS